MNRTATQWILTGLTGLGVVLFLGSGSVCSAFSSGTTTDPMLLEVWDENIDELKVEQAVAAERAALMKKAALEEKLEMEAEKKRNAPPRLRLDPNKIRKLQFEAITEQQQKGEAFVQRQNNFTDWMDGFHALWYCRMDNAVRHLDTKWLTDEHHYDYELSTFKINVLTRGGGRSNEKDFDFKVRFRAKLALPGLEEKVHLVVDRSKQDSLPGADPMEQDDETSLGVAAFRKLKHSELRVGGGVRWRSAGPVVYGDLDWRWRRDWMGGELSLDPRGFWYSDDGLGQVTSLTWTRKTRDRQWFQSRTAERSTEETDGLECEQTVRYVWLRSGRGRGWVAQASTFPHLKSSKWYWDDSLINLTWQDALYRKWIYYTVTPQIDFPREDDYKPRPSLRIGIKILFGGKIGNLI